MILCGHRARRRLRRRVYLEDATFCWRGSGRPRPLELRPSATADSTSNKPISSLGLAGVLELAMRLSYLRVVLSFY